MKLVVKMMVGWIMFFYIEDGIDIDGNIGACNYNRLKILWSCMIDQTKHVSSYYDVRSNFGGALDEIKLNGKWSLPLLISFS